MSKFKSGDWILFSMNGNLYRGYVKCVNGDKVEIEDKTYTKLNL